MQTICAALKMGNCLSKKTPHRPFKFVMACVPGISPFTAYLLVQHTFRKPAELWASFEIRQGRVNRDDFVKWLLKIHNNLPSFHYFRCIGFLEAVSSKIGDDVICLKIAQCIYKDPAAYCEDGAEYERTMEYLQRFSGVVVDIDNHCEESCKFIENIMTELRFPTSNPNQLVAG